MSIEVFLSTANFPDEDAAREALVASELPMSGVLMGGVTTAGTGYTFVVPTELSPEEAEQHLTAAGIADPRCRELLSGDE